MRAGRMLLFAPVAIVGFAVFIAAGGFLVMSLWNWLTPPVFGWHTITFWQALAMLALSRILFGGWRVGGGKSRWRGRMRRNWHRPSHEDRERFKDAVRARYAPESEAPPRF